jgi:hypothetical protein
VLDKPIVRHQQQIDRSFRQFNRLQREIVVSNDKIILDQLLEAKKLALAPSSSNSEFFEIFTAEQVLKDFDLSYEEIEAGILGGGGDGGIDGLYVFVNGDLVRDDTDFTVFKKGIEIELVITQAKTSAGFNETAMDKFTAVSEDLLDLTKPISSFSSVYNTELRSGMELFRKAHMALVARFPKIKLTYVYATKGDTPDPKVVRKADPLREKVQQFFSAATVDVKFLGAAELLALARKQPKTTFMLNVAEAPISSSGDVGYVCLVRLRELYNFIVDESGNLQRNIFEANVRDYQGRTEVNDSIGESLNQAHEDFWWLNNGVTVIASQVTSSGRTLTIEDPQIVNGLQTSTEIFNYFNRAPNAQDNRNLLVRVIVPMKAESRDRIIKATNSQTSVQPASLRATDKIHRDIEEYLMPFGLFYDRRKNRYKNEGKPVERIVSIPLMAQAVMSVVLQRPNDARARPSSLLKSQADYDQLFSGNIPISVYRVCAVIVKRTEGYLKLDTSLARKDRANLRFYVAMYVAAVAVGSAKPSVASLAALDPISAVTDVGIADAYASVKAHYLAAGSSDQAAKGTMLLPVIVNELAARYPAPAGA